MRDPGARRLLRRSLRPKRCSPRSKRALQGPSHGHEGYKEKPRGRSGARRRPNQAHQGLSHSDEGPGRILITISDVFTGYWWVGVILIIGVVMAYRIRVRTLEGRLAVDGWMLRLPVMGNIIMSNALAQFARTLATLLENGVPVLDALQIVEDTMTNLVISRAIREARTTTLINGFATRQLLAEQSLERGRLAGQGHGGHSLRETTEILLTSYEIGLAVDLDQGRGVRIARLLDDDHTLGGHAGGLLVGLREPLLTHEIGGRVEVTLRFDECFLALHHARAGALAELLDCICCDVH